METFIKRFNKGPDRTNGDLYVEFVWFCYTVEDPVREVPGQPVEQWKIPGDTAIPAGRYRLTLENSPKFGPETITIVDVKGYTGIRMHGGLTEDHTEGCPLVGYDLTPDGTITPGLSRPALANLKRVIREAILGRNEQVWITVE